MSWFTIATMIIVLSIVWGGFLACLVLALRRERKRKQNESGTNSVR